MHENLKQKLCTLIEFASLLGQQNNIQEVVRLSCQKAASLVEADHVLIVILNPLTRNTVKVIISDSHELSDKKLKFLYSNISGWVIENDFSILSKNIKSDQRFQKDISMELEIKSVICIPLRIDGKIIGTLMALKNPLKKSFIKNDMFLLENLAPIVSPFLSNTQKIYAFFIKPLPQEKLQKKYGSFGMLGTSEKFITLCRTIESASRCSVRVLLEGESGTGKELVANAIHQISSRNKNKFVAIDCGAIPSNLIESELFGHIKGAFTGANANRKGLMDEADGGTLFIDEITNLPLDMQAKLLRMLQENEIRPLGSNISHKIDVRIITASSCSLNALVKNKAFREDLFYRLSVYPISIPSLDDRREDIPLLANHYLKIFSDQQNKKLKWFEASVMDFIKKRHWQGNVRELENFVERVVTLAPEENSCIDLATLPQEYLNEFQNVLKQQQDLQAKQPLNKSLADYEQQLINHVLIDCAWNQSKAARVLKISEHAMRYKINKLGIKNCPGN